MCNLFDAAKKPDRPFSAHDYTHPKRYGMSLSNPYTTFLEVIRKQHFKGN